MTKLYEARSGWPLSEGMPKSLWVAMGLQGDGMTLRLVERISGSGL